MEQKNNGDTVGTIKTVAECEERKKHFSSLSTSKKITNVPLMAWDCVAETTKCLVFALNVQCVPGVLRWFSRSAKGTNANDDEAHWGFLPVLSAGTLPRKKTRQLREEMTVRAHMYHSYTLHLDRVPHEEYPPPHCGC